MRTSQSVAGFTLLEVIVAVVVLGILAKVAMMKLITPGTLTLPAQAQSVADLLRRAQNVAEMRGQRVGVFATAGSNGSLALKCIPTTSPCTTDASLTLDQGVVLGGSTAVYFNSLGVPINVGGSPAGAPLGTDTNFTVAYATGGSLKTYTVTVSALTGRVSVSN